MSLVEWAKREVEIACKRENPERKEGDEPGCWTEISKEEYEERKAKKIR